MGGDTLTAEEHDGRRLRRNRNRASVIEAYVTLMRSGVLEPSRDELATACGISRRSIYRYFPDETALVTAVADHLIGQFAPMLARPSIGSGTLPERARAFVTGRLDAYDTTAPITRGVRLIRAHDENLTRAFDAIRQSARAHLDEQFAEELDALESDEREIRLTILHLPFLFDALEFAHTIHGDRDTVQRVLETHILRHLSPA